MNIPKQFNLMGVKWKVRLEPLPTEGANLQLGRSEVVNSIITISSNQDWQNVENTFLHELLHVIWWQMGLRSLSSSNEEVEEAIVTALANGLYAFLKANKKCLAA